MNMTLGDMDGQAGSDVVPEDGVLRVLVADDHPVYREGIARALADRPCMELVAEVGDGAEALAEIRRLVPTVAIVDLQLPSMDGVAILEAIGQERLATRVVIVSAYEDSAVVYRALAAGAKAYLTKLSSASSLCDTVQAVARGETIIPPALHSGLADEIRSRRDRTGDLALTARELEVLELIAEGLSAPEIAERLFLGVTTVKTHLQHIYEKFGVSDRAAAVAQAHRRGVLR
jgi:two-component system nitrate/nitrite response regulator NarL